MGSLEVELLDEVIEAGLLLEEVGPCGFGGLLFQGEVHALMPPVLLRVAGLDAFDLDTEPEPPDGELGEVVQGIGTGAGNAIIGAVGAWQAALTEQLLEGGDGQVFAC